MTDTKHSTTAVALPSQPLPPDLIREMAMDIGKGVAAYIEQMYPKAVAAESSTFLLSVRNCIHNEIIAAIGTNTIGEIEQRLERRKKERRKLRALHKATQTITPDTPFEEVLDIIQGGAGLAPDL